MYSDMASLDPRVSEKLSTLDFVPFADRPLSEKEKRDAVQQWVGDQMDLFLSQWKRAHPKTPVEDLEELRVKLFLEKTWDVPVVLTLAPPPSEDNTPTSP